MPEPQLVDDQTAGQKRNIVRGVSQRADRAVVEPQNRSVHERTGENPRRDLTEHEGPQPRRDALCVLTVEEPGLARLAGREEVAGHADR